MSTASAVVAAVVILGVMAVAAVAWMFWPVAPDPVDLPPRPRPVKCHTTGCPCAGWVRVTRRSTREVVRVCAGCHARGVRLGWWVA
jgi:hypothetical protein